MPWNSSPSSYDQWNRWVFQQIARGANAPDGEFADLLRGIREIPEPQSVEQQAELGRSKLGVTLPNLVQTLCRNALAAESSPQSAAIGKRAEQVWYAGRHLADAFNLRAFGSFLRTAEAPGVSADLWLDVVGVALERLPAFPGERPEEVERFFVNLTFGAIQRRDPSAAELLLAGFRFSPFNWGVFAAKAEEHSWPEVLPAIWAAAETRLEELNERACASFVQAGIRLGRGDVVERILATVAFDQLYNWASFARLAAQHGGPGVLRTVWRATHRVRASFDVATWTEFARAVAIVRNAALLDELWAECESLRPYFDAAAWDAFVGAASATESELQDAIESARDAQEAGEGGAVDSDLVDAKRDARLARVQQICDDPTVPVPPDEWGYLAMAAARVERPGLMAALWEAREQRGVPLSSRSWGLWANAAALLGDVELVVTLWQATWASRTRFDPHAWGSFAKAAVTTGNATLLEEVWRSSEPARPGFWKEHAVWGGFVSGAAALGLSGLARSVFRSLLLYFDPTRLPHWGTLYRPLLEAALALPDPEVRQEILETLRSQRADVAYCLRVMRDVPPRALGASGGQFEGACRTLMRFLVAAYFFKAREDFESHVAHVVRAVRALPPNVRDHAWIQLIGRGQEAHGAMVRARYAEALREAVGRPSPWGRLAPAERLAFLGDIRNDGLLKRIARFDEQQARESLQRVLAGEDAGRYRALATFLVRNHLEFLDSATSGEGYWETLRVELDAVGGEGQLEEEWAVLITAVIQSLSGAVIQRMLEKIGRLTHDVLKAACENAARRLRELDLETAEAEMLGRVVANLFYGFDGAITRVGTPPREKLTVNIGPLIRARLVGKRGWSESAEVEVPRVVQVSIPEGARREELEPLFSAIRANAETALHSLPPEGQHFRCTVTQGGEQVLFVVENAFDAEAPPNPYSTSVGLASIQQRVLALDGTFHKPEQTTSGDHPWFRISFTLPAGHGGATEATGSYHADEERPS